MTSDPIAGHLIKCGATVRNHLSLALVALTLLGCQIGKMQQTQATQQKQPTQSKQLSPTEYQSAPTNPATVATTTLTLPDSAACTAEIAAFVAKVTGKKIALHAPFATSADLFIERQLRLGKELGGPQWHFQLSITQDSSSQKSHYLIQAVGRNATTALQCAQPTAT